jgi:hypothetical protein
MLGSGRDGSPKAGEWERRDDAEPSLEQTMLWLVARHSSPPILVLWNVWLWWVWVAVTHFETLIIPTVLHSAIGICLIVGVTLNTNAYALWSAQQMDEQAPPRVIEFLREGPFSALRFFMIPFCVSSYSSIINQECTFGTFSFLFPVADRNGTRVVSVAPDWMVFAGINISLTLLALTIRRFVSPAVSAESRIPTGAGLCDRLLFPQQYIISRRFSKEGLMPRSSALPLN